MATPTQAGNPFKALNALTWSQRISLVVLAAAVVGGVVALIYFMNQEQYQTLYSDLETEEAGTIIERLKALKVTYTVDDSGKSIKVPAERVNELRLQLASEGLPQGGKIGFEIFDRTNLGMTEFVERVSYKRALEGELARTILSLKEIGQARVILSLPKDSLFEDRTEQTKASVVLKLKSGRQLSESVVSGIVHLVSSAVEGLNPSNVTVVDANGRMLSENSGTPQEALTTGQMELKARTEKELTAKVINILEPVVGDGRVKADTSVLMDFSRREQTEEKYDPQAVVRSSIKDQEQSHPTAAAAPAAGVPGTKSNSAEPAPVFIPLGGQSAGADYSKQHETTNYEVSKVVRRTWEPTATIQKLSVAVIVDDAVQPGKPGDTNTARKTAPRSPEDLKKIKDLVTAAVGIDTMRGDLLTVENIAFEAPPEVDEAPTGIVPELKTLTRPALRYTAFLVLFLLAYLLLYRPLSKRIFVSVDETLANRSASGAEIGSASTMSLATPKTVKELEAAMADGHSMPQVTTADVNKTDILKQRIAEFVQRDPEKGAQLVRSWLTEEGKS